MIENNNFINEEEEFLSTLISSKLQKCVLLQNEINETIEDSLDFSKAKRYYIKKYVLIESMRAIVSRYNELRLEIDNLMAEVKNLILRRNALEEF